MKICEEINTRVGTSSSLSLRKIVDETTTSNFTLCNTVSIEDYIGTSLVNDNQTEQSVFPALDEIYPRKELSSKTICEEGELYAIANCGISIDFHGIQSFKKKFTGKDEGENSEQTEDEDYTPFNQVNMGPDVYNFHEAVCEDEYLYDLTRFNPHRRNNKYITSENQVFECCSLQCLATITNQTVSRVKELIDGKSKKKIKDLLLNQLKYQHLMGSSTNGFIVNGHFFCEKSFSELTKLSKYIMKDIFEGYKFGISEFVHGNSIGLRQSSAVTGFICWMKRFSHLAGNYSPDEQLIVLSSCYTIHDLYHLYIEEINGPVVAKSTFYRLFHSKFGHNRLDKSLPCLRLSKYTSHSRCDQCADLEKFRKSAKTEEELKMAKAFIEEHKQTYVRTRILIEEKRHLSLTDPDSHVFVQGEGLFFSTFFIRTTFILCQVF